jgi:hypothetical protein
MVIAVWARVTVSMAALRRGIFSLMFLVSSVDTSASLGRTKDFAGTSNTSSNVKPVGICSLFIETTLCSIKKLPDITGRRFWARVNKNMLWINYDYTKR